MNNSKAVAATFAGICVIGIVIGVSWHRFALRSVRSQVTLEPRVQELTQRPLQWQVVSARFQLTNHSDDPVTVTRAASSCGCTNLVTRGGRSFEAPLTLNGGESLPWQVDINTHGRLGHQEFFVEFDTHRGELSQTHRSSVVMEIRSGLEIDPPQITFTDLPPDTERTAEITIRDPYPGPQLVVHSVEVSDPGRIDASIVQDFSLRHTLQRDSEGMAKKRATLKISYRSPATNDPAIVHDQVKLFLDDRVNDLTEIVVPIVGRMTRPKYRLKPDRVLLLEHETGQPIQRTIRCHLGPGSTDELMLLRAPEFAAVKLENVDAQTIDIHITLAKSEKWHSTEDPAAIVIAAGQTGAEEFRIPVTWRGEDEAYVTSSELAQPAPDP